jgi:hypothetical protein
MTTPNTNKNTVTPDTDTALVVEEMFRLKAIIEQATEQYDALRASLLSQLNDGDVIATDSGTISCRTPRRFSADQAKEILQPAVVDAISEKVVSQRLAKEFLSPRLYRQCQVEGTPTVYVSLPKQGN